MLKIWLMISLLAYSLPAFSAAESDIIPPPPPMEDESEVIPPPPPAESETVTPTPASTWLKDTVNWVSSTASAYNPFASAKAPISEPRTA